MTIYDRVTENPVRLLVILNVPCPLSFLVVCEVLEIAEEMPDERGVTRRIQNRRTARHVRVRADSKIGAVI